MKPFASSLLAVVFAMVPLAQPLLAQEVVQPLGQTDADLLAAQMRQLAANPRDMDALAQAGELSIKLGDLSAAASLFARADKIDPRNGRIKAGMGSILVRSERPGEALRFFDQAEKAGWTPARFAADRGLAYDLTGDQPRAQQDYRTALANGRDDETIRRYALSLGISGQQAQAIQQLDPLVRKQDRAGWRAQAFVLAMNGDTAAAAKIATTMMPANMAQGLAAFFQRLPSLSPVDRAFAVHFGEIYPTPERLADAKLTPRLAPLQPVVSTPPLQVAAVAPTTDRRRDNRSRPSRTTTPVTAPVVTVAAVTPPPAVSTVVAPTVAAQPTPIITQPATQVAAAPVTPAIIMAAPRAVVQAVPQQPEPQPTIVAARAPVAVAPVQSSAATVRADAVLARIVASLSIPAAELGVEEPARAASPIVRPPVPGAVAASPSSDIGRRVVAEASAKEARDTAVRRAVAAKLTGDAQADDAAPARNGRASVAKAEPVPKTAAGRRAAARKAAALAKEEAALAVAEAEPVPKTAAGRRAAARKAAAAKEEATLAAVEAEPAPKTAAGRRAAARKAAAAAKEEAAAQTPAERRAAARAALVDKKKAAEAKALADKAAAEKKAARANPSRIWVQVASGANEGDLSKAWKGVKGKAATTLATRGGYTVPFKATNRVMTGPFKTDAEARAFVNQLAKQGVAGFAVTTEAGQQVARLPAK